MKRIFSVLSIVITMLFYSCNSAQTQTPTTLSAPEFAAKIKAVPGVTIVDVRTPGEFSKGHLVNAENYDWNGSDFDNQIATLDKSKPVLVYCLSGGRSAAAANKMRAAGFKEVYELAGGIIKWRAFNLPETTGNTALPTGMTKQQFDALLNTDKLVLVDFNAEWCAPCKKMKPYLDEIARDMADKVIVVSINTDDNQALCKELKVDALPFLHLYKNKTLTWSNAGFIEKAEVVKQLK